MKLREFKQMVHAEFGPHMEHATPSNVREFLDELNPLADTEIERPVRDR